MLKLTPEHKIDVMSAKNKPAASCYNGELVCFETLDCYDGVIRRDGSRIDRKRMYNPATGPLFVEGAHVGDALRVDILKIETRDWGAMGTFFGEGAFRTIQREDNAMYVYDIKDGYVEAGGYMLPVNNMIGVIGVAPAGEGVLTITPGSHGGNMDCRRIKQNSTIYFPVAVEGALLAMGDLHALMGDGEVFGYGLEVTGEVTVKVSVEKGLELEHPLLIEGGEVMSIASGKTMQEATENALTSMYRLLLRASQPPAEAGILMSMVCNVSLCQMVNPLYTVRASMPEGVLSQLIKR